MLISERCFIVRESSRSGLGSGKSEENLHKLRKQMTSCKAEMVHSPTSKRNRWRSSDWTNAWKEVRRLQMRIAKAVQEEDYGRIYSLQWTLTHSFYAKALAVKRVTSNDWHFKLR